jgi:hypothetical protein
MKTSDKSDNSESQKYFVIKRSFLKTLNKIANFCHSLRLKIIVPTKNATHQHEPPSGTTATKVYDSTIAFAGALGRIRCVKSFRQSLEREMNLAKFLQNQAQGAVEPLKPPVISRHNINRTA